MTTDLLKASLLGLCLALAPVATADDSAAAATKEHHADDARADKEHAEAHHAESNAKKDGGSDAKDAEAKQDAEPEKDWMMERVEELKKETALLKAEYELEVQRLQSELKSMELKKQRMQAKSALHSTELNRELEDMRAEKARIDTRLQLENAERNAELHELNAEIELLNKANQLMQARAQQAKLAAELAKFEHSAEIAELQSVIDLRKQRDTNDSMVLEGIDYKKNPFRNGSLYISDRRIALNGPIMFGTANYVTDRIHYFNNQNDEYPIFIVIDSCPGGSVSEGARILEAMENSDAPVYVVVKQYAASMAAFITTLAERSFAYPNAKIMHHQISYGAGGNLSQQRDRLESAAAWAERLNTPLMEKMGVETEEELYALMYENDVDGDWEEFADEAQKLNWVTDIVHEIREQSFRDEPTTPRNSISFFFGGLEEQTDADGRPFIRLPRLPVYDFYAIDNRDGYYRY